MYVRCDYCMDTGCDVPDDFVGKRLRCPRCKLSTVIEGPFSPKGKIYSGWLWDDCGTWKPIPELTEPVDNTTKILYEKYGFAWMLVPETSETGDEPKLSDHTQRPVPERNEPEEDQKLTDRTSTTFPHTLLYGPPGVGKSTLANRICGYARYYSKNNIRIGHYTPLNMSSKEDIYSLIDVLLVPENKHLVIFIDEIHGLSRVVEESLYSLIQDFKGIDRDGQMVDVPPFTMVGATTILGEVNKPFLDRFPVIIELEPLSEEELVEVIDTHSNGSKSYVGQKKALAVIELHARNLATRSNVPIPEWIKHEIARRSLGNPRIALRITRHFQAVCNCEIPFVNCGGIVSSELDINMVNYWFDLIGIDENGLHNVDLRVVRALLERDNEPMGVIALACAAQSSKIDVEQVIEPRLEYAGFLERTPQGRKLTMKAIKAYKKQV